MASRSQPECAATPATAGAEPSAAWPSIDPRSPNYCYQPCENGLHVCGFHPDGMNFLTVANLPAADAEAAEVLFEWARAECSVVDGEPHDLVVDLQQNGDCTGDFGMSRQMLERLLDLGTSETQS